MNEFGHGLDVVCIYSTADGTSRLVDGRIPLRANERGIWSDSHIAKSWIVAKGFPSGGKDWHRGARAVLSIVTAGAWEIEAGNGEKRRLGTGSVLVVLDTIGQGHRSRVLGDEPCVVIGVELDGDVDELLRTFAGDGATAVSTSP